MKTKPPHPILRGVILATPLLVSAAMQSVAGESTARPTPSSRPTVATNPLSFLDGTVVFDTEERFRWEIRGNNFDFNDAVNAPTDDNWFLQRFRIGVRVKPTSWLKIYAQGQDSREINSDRPDFPGVLGAEGDDTFDLRQGYLEIGNAQEFLLVLKFGRQVLSYGDERLIGAFDWNNIGRTFDAVKLRWEENAWWLDAFASSVVVPERGSYNQSDFLNGNETYRQQILSGLYFSTTALGPQTTDLYVLHLHENASPRFQQNPFGDTNFLTLGTRMKSKPGAFAKQDSVGLSKDGKTVAEAKPPRPVGFDYEGEFAFQTGDARGLDLTAFAAHVGTGFTFDTSWQPRLGVAYSFGSGDGDPSDQDVETFQNLFPTNHKFYGQMDLFSWQNLHNLEFNLKAQPIEAVSLKAEFHAFWLATIDDAWYRANGSSQVRTLNATARRAGNYAGSEVDLTATWHVNKHLQVEGGYSHFFAGDYLSDTGASDDADFGYIQAKLTF